ncbi:MAG: hypothetical protein U5K53_03575 [Halanaerobiales bacterium]|nr:hypothetical protein [Halanaerobiales bacterium]
MGNNNIEKNILDIITKLVRDRSAQAQITTLDEIKEKVSNLTDEEFEDKIEILKTDDKYKDIRVLSGKKGRYLFSDNDMTLKYAKLMAQIEENDVKGLIAKTVREDSKIYPRPTDTTVFNKSPFYLEDDVLIDVIEQMKDEEEYKDIQEVEASNGALYLFSNKHMEKIMLLDLQNGLK